MRPRFLYICVAVPAVMAVLTMSTLGQTPGNRNAAQATPRMPDGKPDLSGLWAAGGGAGRPIEVDEKGNIEEIFPSRRCGPSQVNCDQYTNQSVDGEFTGR